MIVNVLLRIQVFQDCKIVYTEKENIGLSRDYLRYKANKPGSENYKKMPNRVSARQLAVSLEKEDTEKVEKTTDFELWHSDELVTAQDDHSRRPDSDYDVENCLNVLIALVEDLRLIDRLN